MTNVAYTFGQVVIGHDTAGFGYEGQRILLNGIGSGISEGKRVGNKIVLRKLIYVYSIIGYVTNPTAAAVSNKVHTYIVSDKNCNGVVPEWFDFTARSEDGGGSLDYWHLPGFDFRGRFHVFSKMYKDLPGFSGSVHYGGDGTLAAFDINQDGQATFNFLSYFFGLMTDASAPFWGPLLGDPMGLETDGEMHGLEFNTAPVAFEWGGDSDTAKITNVPTAAELTFSGEMDLNIETVYKSTGSTVASISSNSLYFWIWSPVPGAQSSYLLNYNFQVLYDDN